jgi:UTP--glucose-1-phosphate uridylyltransferase
LNHRGRETQEESTRDKVSSGAYLLVKKAVITAAAQSQRTLPLQSLIDGEGNKKSLLGILIEQSLAAGVEEIAIVVWPGDEFSYAQAAGL